MPCWLATAVFRLISDLGHPPVAVSSEGGAVEEGEVEAGEAVHGLPQEGGGPEQLAKRTRLLILLYMLAIVNRSVESKARLRNLCNGEK
jgi:hypothetical protein